jgi:hypothetical protein
MAPAEQRAQNVWAQEIIKGTGVCPQDFGWERVEPYGYQCLGKHHLITDELLAQGRGGLWLVPAGKAGKMDTRWGPYYPDPQKETRLKFGGDPSNDGPDWTDVEIQAWYWPKAWSFVPEAKGPPGNEEDYKILEQAFSRIWLRSIKIHSNSSGATLYIRKGDKNSDTSLVGSISRGISSLSNRSGSRRLGFQPAPSSRQQSNNGSERPSPVSRDGSGSSRSAVPPSASHHSSSCVSGLNDPRSPSASRQNSSSSSGRPSLTSHQSGSNGSKLPSSSSRRNNNVDSERPTMIYPHSSSSSSERHPKTSGHSKKPGSEFFSAGPSHISRTLYSLRNPAGHPSQNARHSRHEYGSSSASE